MSFMCTVSTFVEVVPRVPLHLARGSILFLCDSIQAQLVVAQPLGCL